MSLSPARAYLASRVRFGIKMGLRPMRRLLRELGDPQAAYPCLLVAGTNGKGSVSAYLDAALRAAGLKVGRTTSPHLVRVNERIAVGGRDISDAALFAGVDRVRAAAQLLVDRGELEAHPTYFEVLVAVAFDHFARRAVDVAVVEVGLGGRLDATNTCEPLVSAIVTIGRDHEIYLGHGLASIAREKAGVLRPGRTTVIGRLPQVADRAVRSVASKKGARIVRAAATPLPRDVALLPGEHQRDNARVAVAVLREARAAGLRFPIRAAVAGLSAAKWPGRLQTVPGHPPLVLDGAHNVDGARALAAWLRPRGPFVLVFGAMADKDVETIAGLLFPLAEAVVLTRAPGERAALPHEIHRRAGGAAPAAREEPSVGRALALARRLTAPDGTVVVAGSLYLVGDVLARLQRRRRSRK